MTDTTTTPPPPEPPSGVEEIEIQEEMERSFLEYAMRAIGFEDFRFVGTQLLRGFTAAGLVFVLLGTGVSVLIAVIYNLISDLVGGIELTVLEEDVRPAPATLTAAPTTVVRGQDRTVRAEEQTIAPGYPA